MFVCVCAPFCAVEIYFLTHMFIHSFHQCSAIWISDTRSSYPIDRGTVCVPSSLIFAFKKLTRLPSAADLSCPSIRHPFNTILRFFSVFNFSYMHFISYFSPHISFIYIFRNINICSDNIVAGCGVYVRVQGVQYSKQFYGRCTDGEHYIYTTHTHTHIHIRRIHINKPKKRYAPWPNEKKRRSKSASDELFPCTISTYTYTVPQRKIEGIATKQEKTANANEMFWICIAFK